MLYLRFIAGLCLLVLAFPAAAQDSPFPIPTGTYQVGTTFRHWVDESRDETYPSSDAGDKRELMVYFWYPAEVSADQTPNTYMPDSATELPALTAAIKRISGLNLDFPVRELGEIQSHAFLNAPLADADTRFPVLIFSHGLGAFPRVYTSQLEELASHGYVVAAINHTYGSAATVFPDGRIIEGDFSVPVLPLVSVWSRDQIFVLNQLETLDLNDPDDRFTGKLDVEHVGVFGHSLGGAATAKTCLDDSRCAAGINEDGFVTADVLRNGLAIPFMMMRNEEGSNGEDMVLFRRSSGAAYLLTFADFGHLNFSDVPLWMPEGPGIGSVDHLHSVQTTNAYVLAFFNQYLRGESQALLEGAVPEYPEVDFLARNT